MDFISALFVLPILLIALGTMYVIAPIIGIDAPTHRYAAIDGLRGFLAMLVFLHHSFIWYYYSRGHQWFIVRSGLFTHFGSTSVALFFMITAFLFFSKLMDSYGREFDWTKLYVGRVMRIMPLYVFAVIALFLMVGFATHFVLKEPFSKLLQHLGEWLLIMEPNVNRLDGTKFIIAGVQWSLAYEWLFYCSLALIGRVFFRLKPSLLTILLSLVFLGGFGVIIAQYYSDSIGLRLLPFGSGLAAAFIVRRVGIRNFLAKVWLTPVLLLLLLVALLKFPSIFSVIPFLCVSFVFIGIACGNNFFGILSWKLCRQLGQISYSLYLLHGLVLFVSFYFVLGVSRAARFTVMKHWLVICVCSVIVVVLCSLTYRFIERPGTENAAALTKRIRLFFGRGLPPASPIAH